MKNSKNFVKMYMVVLMCLALLITGSTGLFIYASLSETNIGGGSTTVQFDADHYIDATVQVKINGQVIDTISFNEEKMGDEEQTLQIPDIIRTSSTNEGYWVSVDKPGYDSDRDRQVTVEFVITNTSTRHNFTVMCNSMSQPTNSVLSITPDFACGDDLIVVKDGGSITLSYNYYVTGLDTVVSTAQAYEFTLIAE